VSRRILLFFIVFNFFTAALAASFLLEQQVNQLIYSVENLPTQQRIAQISQYFLGASYMLEPLGEGTSGQFNQEPLYRLDAFDCETYVDTVLALTFSNNFQQFQYIIKKIRYKNGIVSFLTRTHFPNADWIPNNIDNGYIQPITASIASNQNTAIAYVYLNRKNWYQQLSADRIKIPGLTVQEKISKLNQLHALANKVKNSEASIVYIPVSKFFIEDQPNLNLFEKIPQSSLIFFVIHDPTLIEKIGTQMNISHMGFVIWKQGQPYLRAASSLKGKIIDLPLINYLHYYANHNASIIGVAFYMVR
jgi:hypothetical protein